MRNILFIVTVQFITCSLMAQHNLTDGLESKYVKPDERAEAPIEFASQKPVYKYNPFAHLSFANLSFEPFTIQYRQDFHGPIERYSLHFEEQAKVPQNKYVFVNGKVHFYDEKGCLESYSAKSEDTYIPGTNNRPYAENAQESVVPNAAASDDLFSYFGFYKTRQLELNEGLRNQYYQMMRNHLGLFCRMVQDELLKNNPDSSEELLVMLQANQYCMNPHEVISLFKEKSIYWK